MPVVVSPLRSASDIIQEEEEEEEDGLVPDWMDQ